MMAPYSPFVLTVFCLVSYSSSMKQPLCHDDDRYSLLQFKKSFAFDKFECDSSPYNKLSSWKSTDCCLWDGVDCDNHTGHVIGLDLSASCLYGSINSNSTLFRLFHLKNLNLAYNNFSFSRIPRGIKSLSRLTYLNLSSSSFSDQIPSEILELSKLVSLDLSDNPLKLQNPGLKDVVESFKDLAQIYLSGAIISSHVPQSFANLTSLSSLILRDCELQGEFPSSIFQLPNLRHLSLRANPGLSGYLPEFQVGCPLEMLRLEGTNFSGQLPHSIGNLKSLSNFAVGGCGFWGPIPSSIGNLSKLNALDISENNFSGEIPSFFSNLNQLIYLSLSSNNFTPATPFWLPNLANLQFLDLAHTNLYGDVLSFLGNLTQLAYLWLFSNQLTGQIPSWLGNFTQLIEVQIANNGLQGPIPESIFGLPNLEILELYNNNLSGTLKSDSLLRPKYLQDLQLSYNHLSLINSKYVNVTLPKFTILGLSACNLSEFPVFLRGQNEMEVLELANNRIEGYVPNWISSLATESLIILNMAFNFLTGFEQHLSVLPWNNFRVLNLTSNKLQGLLPIPPPSIAIYAVSKNKFSGDISPLFCNLTSLLALDLSNNNLSGHIPPCLGNLSNFASVLDLRNNSLSGKIPDRFTSGCTLKVMDFSQNKLKGKVPRSLINCSKLEILNLGKNQINDVFPSWLGVLPHLRVLTLRSNKLHGAIGKPLSNFEFDRLQIIDLSENNFTGKLPLEYIGNWIAMKTVDNNHLIYMQANTSFQIPDFLWTGKYMYSIRIMNKGTETVYEKILEFFVAVDLSSNRFEGEIPEIIGNLKEVQLLNLSNNILSGRIPSSFGNIRALEALDLSLNKLLGEIPMQLTQLTFLSFFNVSHNNLTGPIPKGNQFETFKNDSYSANLGLCGDPLSKKCGDSLTLPLAPSEYEDSDAPFEFGWKVVLMGYACGLVLGIGIGCTLSIRKCQWLMKKFPKWHWQRFQ